MRRHLNACANVSFDFLSPLLFFFYHIILNSFFHFLAGHPYMKVGAMTMHLEHKCPALKAKASKAEEA